MKVKKVTKIYFELEDGRRFDFDESLKKVPSPQKMQKMLEANAKYLKDMISVINN